MIQDHGQKWVDEIKPQSSYIQFKEEEEEEEGDRDHAVILMTSSFLIHLALRYKLYPVYSLPLEKEI